MTFLAIPSHRLNRVSYEPIRRCVRHYSLQSADSCELEFAVRVLLYEIIDLRVWKRVWQVVVNLRELFQSLAQLLACELEVTLHEGVRDIVEVNFNSSQLALVLAFASFVTSVEHGVILNFLAPISDDLGVFLFHLHFFLLAPLEFLCNSQGLAQNEVYISHLEVQVAEVMEKAIITSARTAQTNVQIIAQVVCAFVFFREDHRVNARVEVTHCFVLFFCRNHLHHS